MKDPNSTSDIEVLFGNLVLTQSRRSCIDVFFGEIGEACGKKVDVINGRVLVFEEEDVKQKYEEIMVRSTTHHYHHVGGCQVSYLAE